MNNSYYSGSSYYDEEEVSMRSDPPIAVGIQSLAMAKQPSQQAAPATHVVSMAGAALTTNEQNDNLGTLTRPPASQHGLDIHSNKSFKFENLEEIKQEESKRSQTSKKSENADKTINIQDTTDSDNRELKDADLKNMKVSDILQGNFAPIEIPILEIPGTTPLIYNEPEELLAEINEKDEFMVDDKEEEFFMFTAEILDENTRAQDGPFQTLRWRKRVRNFQLGLPLTTESNVTQLDEDPTQIEESADDIRFLITVIDEDQMPPALTPVPEQTYEIEDDQYTSAEDSERSRQSDVLQSQLETQPEELAVENDDHDRLTSESEKSRYPEVMATMPASQGQHEEEAVQAIIEEPELRKQFNEDRIKEIIEHASIN